MDRQQQWESVEQNRINTIIDQMNGNGLTDLTVEINAHDIAIRFFPTNDTGRVISDLKNIYRRCIKPTRTEGHHVFYRADAIGAYMYIREASAGNGHANLTPRLIKQIKAKIRERYEEMRLEVKQKSQECNKLDLVRV